MVVNFYDLKCKFKKIWKIKSLTQTERVPTKKAFVNKVYKESRHLMQKCFESRGKDEDVLMVVGIVFSSSKVCPK